MGTLSVNFNSVPSAVPLRKAVQSAAAKLAVSPLSPVPNVQVWPATADSTASVGFGPCIDPGPVPVGIAEYQIIIVRQDLVGPGSALYPTVQELVNKLNQGINDNNNISVCFGCNICDVL